MNQVTTTASRRVWALRRVYLRLTSIAAIIWPLLAVTARTCAGKTDVVVGVVARMQDPFERFQELFARAKSEEASDATAMSLATADAQGRPSVRMVLLKGVDPRGFVFFTNYESRKARELDTRPHAALCLHWPTMRVQVRVEGPVEKLTAAESDAYFATRARLSQVGAWASRQSQALPGRAWLVARVLRYTVRFAGQSVPRPEHWGGFRVVPERLEFWFDQVYRLHDRLLYERVDGAWRMRRLYP